MRTHKLILNKCEIDGCDITDSNLLELHNIIPRTDCGTSNNLYNLAILCCNHHAMIGDRLKIIGIYPSTKLPNKRTMIYELDGKRNIDIEVPIIQVKIKSFKIFNGDK